MYAYVEHHFVVEYWIMTQRYLFEKFTFYRSQDKEYRFR